MVGFGEKTFEVGVVAIGAAAAKVEKHEAICIVNQHYFILFAFDPFGINRLLPQFQLKSKNKKIK